MMCLVLLLFVAAITALVTWSLNRREAVESAKETKQVIKGKPTATPEASQASLFRAWLKATDKIDPSLQTWLSTLSEEELNTVSQQVASYCKSLGMELDWLLHASPQLPLNQTLQKTMLEIVVADLTSRYKAAQVQDEAKVEATYQAFNKNPESDPNLIRHLFAKLVDDGLVTMSSSDLLEDDPQKRQEYMINSIRQTASNEPVGFNNALKAVVLL